jgi:serine/threonine protein kinase/tetratricopeptide (TPR) repeat protein
MIGQTISHYKIIEKLGEGGMGVVYKAHDLKLDRFVALKFLPQQLNASDQNKARFIQEAKAASSLNHPNILTIHDIDENIGQLFIVMEYVEGETIKAKIRNEKLTMPQILEWASQIADGLRAAHEKGIIHRDVKSDNFMVTKDGRAKIMDFGLAKLKGSGNLTKTGSTVGTIAYMSPEQFQGEGADQRSDIWSFGVVLYEMLTGELPFKAEHEAGWMYSIVNEQPLVPSALDRRISHQVDSFVMKMLQKDRSQRYQSVEELLNSFKEVRKEFEAASSGGRMKAIAVLPFDNISPDKESDYFSDGLTEELIANLSRLKDMRVVSRTTSMQYKDTKKDIKTIGRELGARYIMEGSVRKFQDNLRITAQLVDVETDAQVWAETYKGKLADIFDIQEQVSKQIVDALMVKLTPTEKVVLTKRATLNAEAFDCYLRARAFLYRFTKHSMHFAVQLFQKAIELDPRYAGAYAGLGESYAQLYQQFERNEIWLDKAIESSLKALMYDSTLSEAYAALALAYYNKRQFDEAVAASQKAIELEPGNFLGYWILGRIYHGTDRDREAVDLFKKVVALNPDFYSVYGDLQIVYGRLGEKEKYNETLHAALIVYARYLSQHPDDARGHMYFATDLAQVGRYEEAKAEAAKALDLSPDDPLMLYNAACFYTQMGEKLLALEALENSISAGYANFEWVKRDSDLDAIRNEPKYIELMRGR